MSNAAAPSSTALYNVEIEAHAISCLIQYPDAWGDFQQIISTDWSKTHKPVFDVIKQQLDQTPPASINPLVLSEKLKSYGLSMEGGLGDFAPYLDGLRIRFVQKSDAPQLARELKRLSVRRDLIGKMDQAKRQLIETPGATFDEMAKLVERGLTSIQTEYHTASEFTNVFEGIIEQTEERGANPIDASKLGYMGPFSSINRSLGALTDKGLLVTIGARTGNQKSALGFHYNLFLAETYNIPILLLDVGEMSVERIRRRAVCCMAEGKVPLWAIASGEWTKDKAWTRIIRQEIWPRVAKLRIDYINVGNMSPREKIAVIRRYYFNRVGRGNPLGILDDYTKGVEALGKNSSEYQSVGYYIQDVKSLITNEIPAWYWTSVQNNRTGSYQGKKASDIVDSDDQMGLSDRIIQQSDWGFILRFKVMEEIAAEQNLFGNMKLVPVKMREALGRDFERTLKPVKLANGRFSTNFFNLDTKSFHFTDKGDLNHMISILGTGAVEMGQEKEKAVGL